MLFRARFARSMVVGMLMLAAPAVWGMPVDAAVGPRIARDVRPGPEGSDPSEFVPLGGRVALFRGDDGTHGIELWRTDGTRAGTRLVKDIQVGPIGSGPDTPIRLGNALYFAATTAARGTELWKTDGTGSGTRRVKDINPGPASSSPQNLVRIGTRLYFWADDGEHGRELWRSDGSTAGTKMVKDINPGPDDSDRCCIRALGTTLIFSADDGEHGFEPWRSKGTAASTRLLVDVVPGTGDSDGPDDWAIAGGVFFFTAEDDLWRTDGTVAGTEKIQDFQTVGDLAVVGGHVVFQGNDGTSGREPWASDGTPQGTQLLKDVNLGPGGSGARMWHDGPVNGYVLFHADDDSELGMELWRTNGTPAGTKLVKDINQSSAGADSADGSAYRLKVGRSLYFIAEDGVHGEEVWRTDGTASGTRLIKDILQGAGSSDPGLFNDGFLDGVVYFRAGRPATGQELWRTKGTPASTRLLKDVRSGPADADPGDVTAVGDRVYFRANDGSRGSEPWVYVP